MQDPVRRMLSARADVNVSNALGETPLLPPARTELPFCAGTNCTWLNEFFVDIRAAAHSAQCTHTCQKNDSCRNCQQMPREDAVSRFSYNAVESGLVCQTCSHCPPVSRVFFSLHFLLGCLLGAPETHPVAASTGTKARIAFAFIERMTRQHKKCGTDLARYR